MALKSLFFSVWISPCDFNGQTCTNSDRPVLYKELDGWQKSGENVKIGTELEKLGKIYLPRDLSFWSNMSTSKIHFCTDNSMELFNIRELELELGILWF